MTTRSGSGSIGKFIIEDDKNIEEKAKHLLEVQREFYPKYVGYQIVKPSGTITPTIIKRVRVY
jgi:hypothetical protein